MLVADAEKCAGCGLCVPFCPNEALRVWGTVVIVEENCSECFDCVAYCPTDALEIEG
ncbi:MAG: 4Fe-4S binding protein [Desulfatiglans sp.]|nr:4Fe-4S binding protein [Desulfatiglans sp.]